MSKRKREKGDIGSAEGTKHKRVKERSEEFSKAERHHGHADAILKSPEKTWPAINADSTSKALKRREARLEKTGRKQTGDLPDGKQDGLYESKNIIDALEGVQATLDNGPLNKALNRQEAKKRRKEKRHAESSKLEDRNGLIPNVKKAVEKPAGKSRLKRKAHEKSHKDQSSSWKVSDAVGGQMLDLDPLFSQNEE